MSVNPGDYDDMDIFYQSFISRIRKISAKTMTIMMGKVESDLLNSDICWMVTDNLKGILGYELTSEYGIEYEDTNDNLYNYLHDNITTDHMLIIGQDLVSTDHWFAVIGNMGYAYIFEFQPDKCIGFNKYTYEDCIELLINIQSGKIEDRFYNETKTHSLKIYSYYRYTLSKESIDWYLYK